MTSICDLAATHPPVAATATGRDVLEIFQRQPDIMAVAVVDDDRRPVGLVERNAFFLRFSGNYGRSLYARRPIALLMDASPIIVEGAQDVSAFVADALFERSSELLKGFIVVEDGVYHGVGTAMELLRSISTENARRAEAQAVFNDTLAQTHAEAAEAHARLRQAVEVMPEGLAFFDAEDRLVLWNQRYADLHPVLAPMMVPGIPFIDMLKHGLEAGEFPDAAGCEEAWIAERLAWRARGEGCHEQALANRRWLRIEERSMPSGGRINVLVDITELKRREASFRLLFEGNPIPMIVFDVETFEIRAVNAAAEIQYGYPRDAVIGRPTLDFVSPEDRDASAAWLSEHIPGDRDPVVRRHLTADGRTIEVMPYLQSLSWDDRPSAIAALIDVTATRAAEAERRRTQAFLDAVIETMPAMLVVKDAVEHRFVMINKAGEELLATPRAELLGKNDYDFFPKEQADFFVACDKEVLASGEVHTIEEEPILTQDKGERFLSTKKVAMRGPDGTPEHILIICQDVTERRADIQALTEARDAAEAANRAKSAFLANMSHEIRTPLNGVIGIVDALARTGLDGGQAEMVELVRSSAETLERLLSDVLDLARVESGRIEIHPEPFHLGEAVREVARLCRPAADGKGVALRVEIAPEADRMGLGDGVRVRQVLTNLVSNAVKFTAEGEVRLVAAPDSEGDRVRFEVIDTGVGFDAEQKARIFGRFQQADGSITRRFGGTGLGLSISRELAELMDAELDCESAPGEGATFTFRVTLPSVEDAADARDEAAGPAAPEIGAPVRALLADDHPVNRKVVELLLTGSGVALETVENGHEACEAVFASKFDLVLMDMQMPVMDGLTAVREIRAREARSGAGRIPIVMLTANAMAEHVDQSLAAGADLHLGKPIRADALHAAIARALEIGAADETFERREAL
jgi:PAS domain S-box-containing protein